MNNMFASLRQTIQDENDASWLKQALNIVVQSAREVMQVDAVSVYFLDEKMNQLVLMATDGLNQSAIER